MLINLIELIPNKLSHKIDLFLNLNEISDYNKIIYLKFNIKSAYRRYSVLSN